MKQYAIVLLSSFFSALLAVTAYRTIEEPQKIFIKETLPAKYVEYDPLEINGTGTNLGIAGQYYSPSDFTQAAAIVTPAVVNIKATEQSGYFWQDGVYGASTGSGVIISPDGYIVTNRHVIEEGTRIEVTLNDKREFEAKVIGVDPSTDLALLKIEAKDLAYLPFGNSDSVTVGEWVLAVGNPFNLESTVTAGIVSAKGRNIDILQDQYSIESFIQTDAAVNPGNSGGALVNTDGQLIGINTAIITRSGRYEGYSFAVPSNLAGKVIRDLKEFGEVQRAILGVNIEPVDNSRAQELDLPSVEGVYVSRVTPKGGAEEAGLRAGDVIVNINGVKIRTMPELQEQIGRYRPGNVVTVQYYRNSKLTETKVTLRNKQNTVSLTSSHEGNLLMELGFELRDLTLSEQRRLRIKGVKVTSIYRGSKIERTEMDPDYIITKVNDIRVTSVEDALKELKNARDKVFLEGFYENYPGEYYYTFSMR